MKYFSLFKLLFLFGWISGIGLFTAIYCSYSSETTKHQFPVTPSFKSTMPLSTNHRWNGFEKEIFSFEGREAWIVKPVKPLAGNPWIWKAYFPDWHTSIDSILLSKGFYLAYINTNEMYGSPAAMQIWDRFYDYLVNQKGFAPKVALEGISRGGLYVYGWAKRNPLNVSCIYGETPLCDFKSWPGGGANGSRRSENDWNVLLNCYGFSEEEALNYDDNPKDHLQGLAACKVPILHSIGIDDRICPPEENTYPLVNSYIRYGGIAMVFPMTRGKQELEGHHFPIETPEKIADFIFINSYPVVHPLDAAKYISTRNGLQNSLLKFKKEKKGTVAFLGGSITENSGWRDKICKYLKESFPETNFSFINAGISSTGSTPGAFRLERDVLSKGKVDLLFEEAAVNDRTNFFSGIAQIRGMEGIIRHAKIVNPFIDIVVMYFASPDNLADYNNSVTPDVIVNHDSVASHYQVSAINLAKEVTDRISAGEFSWEYDFKDVHPSPFGQEVYFRSIKKLIYNSLKKIDISASPVVRRLPEPIDKYSYSNGNYLSVKEATIINDWWVVENWMPSDSAASRRQYINLPTLIADKPGANMELTFVGNGVGICAISGPDAGIIEYGIDDQPFHKLDLFTIWSKAYHLPWYLVLGEQLSEGRHTLKIRTTSDKNPKSQGNACRIVHFLINK